MAQLAEISAQTHAASVDALNSKIGSLKEQQL
jgi:hypothetical protein